jgi:hypothetical protein
MNDQPRSAYYNHMALAVALQLVASYIPPEQYRHEQISSLQSAFSRFGTQGLDGAIAKQDLPDFLRFVAASMNSPSLPQEQVQDRSAELSKQLMAQLPADVSRTPLDTCAAGIPVVSLSLRPQRARYSLDDMLRGTERLLVYPPPTQDELESERGRLGACKPHRSCHLLR